MKTTRKFSVIDQLVPRKELSLPGSRRGGGIVTALPTGAVVGQRCYYRADKTNGIYWHLLYDGEGEYPWKKIGGPPLSKSSNTPRARNNAAYGALPTDPLQVTVPLKGDYDIRIEGQVFNGAAGRFGWLSYKVGGTAASDNWAIEGFDSGTVVAALGLSTRQTGVTAEAVVEEQARTSGGECSYTNRRLWVDPIRVG